MSNFTHTTIPAFVVPWGGVVACTSRGDCVSTSLPGTPAYLSVCAKTIGYDTSVCRCGVHTGRGGINCAEQTGVTIPLALWELLLPNLITAVNCVFSVILLKYEISRKCRSSKTHSPGEWFTAKFIALVLCNIGELAVGVWGMILAPLVLFHPDVEVVRTANTAILFFGLPVSFIATPGGVMMISLAWSEAANAVLEIRNESFCRDPRRIIVALTSLSGIIVIITCAVLGIFIASSATFGVLSLISICIFIHCAAFLHYKISEIDQVTMTSALSTTLNLLRTAVLVMIGAMLINLILVPFVVASFSTSYPLEDEFGWYLMGPGAIKLSLSISNSVIIWYLWNQAFSKPQYTSEQLRDEDGDISKKEDGRSLEAPGSDEQGSSLLTPDNSDDRVVQII